MFFVAGAANVEEFDNRQDINAVEFRRKALRDAVLCIGWLKLTSVVCFLLLYLLVHLNSKGAMSDILKIMIAAAIPFQVLHGVLIIVAALERCVIALKVAMYLFLIFATYTTILGCIGAVHYIKSGHLTMHFLLAAIFAIMSMSLLCTILCHDIYIIHAYIIFLSTSNMEPVAAETPADVNNKYRVTEVP